MNFQIASVNSIIIYFGDTISSEVSQKVLNSYELIKTSKLESLIEIVPSYTSIYIEFDISFYSHKSLYETIEKLIASNKTNITKKDSKIVTIPVYYGKEVGIDLPRISKLKNISIEKIIEIHSSKIYDVFTIGFAPGFAYMGSVDESIATPRLENPRTKIPKKSVAIADTQTAVYPKESPGGWNIVGATYIDMFDKSYDGFSYLKIGDKVKFESICKDEYLSNGGVI